MAKEPEHEDHDIHGEWSPEAEQALVEFELAVDIAIEMDRIERQYDRAFRRLRARLVFVPDHEEHALRTEMRTRMQRREKAARKTDLS